jgi:hypothetical protein
MADRAAAARQESAACDVSRRGRAVIALCTCVSVPRRVELRHLEEVYLDTKTIQRLREAPNPVPQLSFLNQSVGGEQDESRIALQFANDTVFLTEARLSHLEANEWFSKIRRFLRRNGWTPISERSS